MSGRTEREPRATGCKARLEGIPGVRAAEARFGARRENPPASDPLSSARGDRYARSGLAGNQGGTANDSFVPA